jgi:hypothetical protein
MSRNGSKAAKGGGVFADDKFFRMEPEAPVQIDAAAFARGVLPP